MPPPPRPRGTTSGRPSVTAPMSERQQMALLMQMTSTSNEAELSPNSQSGKPKDRNERGETPLHIAAKKGDMDAARKLLDQGTDPNSTDFAGWTPLHEAANHGHYHLAQLLLKHGANVNATGLNDVTPLQDAAIAGNQKLVKMLIDKGADPMFKNKKGKNTRDVAHPSLMPFLNNIMAEMANKRDSHQQQQPQQQQQQQQKKPSQTVSGDGVKKNENEEAATSSSTTTTSNVPSDVYEFVSTPKHSSCSSGDENPGKNSDKSSDEKSGTDSDTPSAIAQQKRALGNEQQSQEHVDDNSTSADDDMKRKKRKDSDVTSKDNNKIVPTTTANTGTNRVTSRVGQKPPGPASKTMGLMNKGVNLTSTTEQCASPKMPTKSPESDHNEMSLVEDGKVGDGLKVPPLKIVIPPHNNSSASSTSSSDNQDQHPVANQRTNKNSSTTRTHPGLPYIVASSNSNDGISEKDPITSTTATTPAVTGARCQSPSADSNKSTDDGSTTTTATSAAKSSKSKELRVLRSSQRSGKDGKDDRGSNNSSPQLPVSSTPSPAAQGTDQMTTNETENQQNISAAPAINNSVTSSTSTNQNTSQTTQQQQQQQQQQTPATQSTSNELHPRKRKIKTSSKDSSSSSSVATSSTSTDIKDTIVKDEKGDSIHPHDQPFTNCYQMYIDLRKQIEQRHRSLHTVEPRPLKGFKDYLMNRRTYLLHGKNSTDPNIIIPPLMPPQMKEIFIEQEKERHKLKMRHSVEKEKLVLSKEQEILRVHCKAAQMIANQSQPFSVCTVLKDVEVYNVITPEQEEKYRNKNRERSHGRVFFQALKELDDKWDKIKEAMIIRHTNEAESLHAVQKMDWGWKMKELALCEYKANPEIEELHVPMVDVTDELSTPSLSD